jgi:hypothetical protein
MKGPVKWWRRRKLDRALKEHGTVWVNRKDRILGTGLTCAIPSDILGEPVYIVTRAYNKEDS